MARSYLLSELVEDVRIRCDLPTFSSTTFITQTAVERFIQESIQDLNALLEECYGSDYFLTTGSLTATANTATTNLPSGAGKVRQMFWARGTDDLPEIHKGTPEDMKRAFWSARTWDSGVKYKLTGRAVTWLPMPSQTYTVKIVYTSTQSNIDSSSNPWTAEAGWAEYVVADVCRKIYEREDKDPSVFIAAREKWEQKIRSQAPDREDAEPSTIRDTWRSDRGLSAWELRDKLTVGEF